MFRADVLSFGRIRDGIVKLGTKLIGVGLAQARFDLIDGHAFDPFPGTFADREHAIGAVDDDVVADRLGRITEDRWEEIAAVLGGLGSFRERLADDRCRRREDIDEADGFLADGTGGCFAGPADQEGNLEPAFPNIVLPAVEIAIDLEPGLDRDGLGRAHFLRIENAAVVAAEDHQGVVRDALLVEGIEDAAYAPIQLVDPIAVKPGLALARDVRVRRDRIVRPPPA